MTLRRVLSLAACLLVGAVVGVLGTLGHRSVPPWGLVTALVVLLAAATWVRATVGPVAVMGYAVGWVVAVQVLAAGGPGGDVLVLADTTGYVWAYGGLVVVLAGLALPRTWFAERPVTLTRTVRGTDG